MTYSSAGVIPAQRVIAPRKLTEPYRAQGDVLVGLSRPLQDSDSAVVVGEMEYGEPLIGQSVIYVHTNGHRPARALVMCPGHLVTKWQREAVETIPDADVRIRRNLGDLPGLDPGAEPAGPEHVIVRKGRAHPVAPNPIEIVIDPDTTEGAHFTPIVAPDRGVQFHGIAPHEILWGQNITFYGWFSNDGNQATSETVRVGFWARQPESAFTTLVFDPVEIAGGLSPGRSLSVATFSRRPCRSDIPLGPCSVEMRIDPADVVAESDESDNKGTTGSRCGKNLPSLLILTSPPNRNPM